MMNDFKSQQMIDRADTGQWRMVVYITRTSLEAWLQPLSDLQTSRRIVSIKWEDTGDGAELLRKIENSVYDNPQLLEDYSSDILIETQRTMWVPSEVLEDEERSEKEFTKVYACDPEDMQSERVGNKGILWWLTPGLNSFLSRTFPGARIRSHQGVILAHLEGLGLSSGEVMVLNLREGSCDIILLRNGETLTCSTQRAAGPDEAIYRLLRAAEVYGLSPRESHIAVRDERGDDSGMADALDKLQLDATVLIEEERPVPTAALLTLSK